MGKKEIKKLIKYKNLINFIFVMLKINLYFYKTKSLKIFRFKIYFKDLF
jgi:hypothetical protein